MIRSALVLLAGVVAAVLVVTLMDWVVASIYPSPPDHRLHLVRWVRPAALGSMGSKRPRERPVQRVRECLLLSWAVSSVAACLDAGTAQTIHEIPDR